jgi:streptogramin lyase
MRVLIAVPLSLALLVPFTPAQEKYWVASSGGVTQLDASGYPWQTVTPSSGRDIAVAPDGKVWLPGASITVLNPSGTLFTTITPTAGITPFAIAFDRAGHAWVSSSGASGAVEEFDAAGVSQGVVPLSAAAALGICVDADGNKWIAHRVGPPGSLSRIDAVTRLVTNHPLPAGALFLPIMVYADARGLVTSSHIWTVGDNRGAGAVVELDATGTALNTYLITPSAHLEWLSGDCDSTGHTRYIWIGDWSNGDLWRVDVSNGSTANFPQFTGVGGVTFDGFGKLWITLRTGGVVRRINQTTGATEVAEAIGAINQISTRWQYATVVDQLGDLDGDGASNLVEVMGSSSPFDGCSGSSASLSIGGSMASGGTLTIDLKAAPGALNVIAFATGVTTPPLVFPGISCSVPLNPATFLGSVLQVGPGSLPLAIPTTPSYVGVRMLTQSLNAAVPTFTNVAPILVF